MKRKTSWLQLDEGNCLELESFALHLFKFKLLRVSEHQVMRLQIILESLDLQVKRVIASEET